MRKPPAAVRKLIGLPFEEKQLKKAFDDAGVRQWHLVQETHESDELRIRKVHFYITEARSINISLRPMFANSLAQQLATEFQKRVSGLALPEKPTMDDLQNFIKAATDPETLNAFQEEAEKVLAPAMEHIQRKLDTHRIYPWDHIRYRISRTNLPYLDQSKAPSEMFEAYVANDLLESVRYGKPNRALRY